MSNRIEGEDPPDVFLEGVSDYEALEHDPATRAKVTDAAIEKLGHDLEELRERAAVATGEHLEAVLEDIETLEARRAELRSFRSRSE